MDVITTKSGCFEVRELMKLSEALSLTACDAPLLCEIEFVSDESDDGIRVAKRVDVVEPLIEVIERFAVGEIENEDNADG